MIVSTIIPCYNVEKYISECLISVLDQTHRNIEIICVDDGSTDNTLTILQEFKKKYPSIITVIPSTNKGAPAARNLGLKQATGHFIQFLDADDKIELQKFEKQIAGFHQGVDVVVSDRVHKNEDLTETLNTYYFNEIEKIPLETVIKRIIITSNPLYKKDIVLQLNGYSETLNSAQDWDFHIRLVLAGYKIKYVPGIYLISRKVKGSISSNWVKVSIQAADIVMQLKPQLLRSPWINPNIRHYFSQIYADSAIYCEDIDRSKMYLKELKYWSENNYAFILNFKKRFLIKLIGIDKVINIQRKYRQLFKN